MSKQSKVLIDTVALGATVRVNDEEVGVAGRSSDGVNVVKPDGSWDTVPFGTKVEVTG